MSLGMKGSGQLASTIASGYERFAKEKSTDLPEFNPTPQAHAAYDALRAHNVATGNAAENPNIDKMIRGHVRSDAYMSGVMEVLAGHKGESEHQRAKLIDDWVESGFKSGSTPVASEAAASTNHVDGSSPFEPPPKTE